MRAFQLEEQPAAISEIARSAEQAALGTAEVSRNVIGLEAAAGRTSETSGRLLGASRGMSDKSEELQQAVKRFLDDIRTL